MYFKPLLFPLFAHVLLAFIVLYTLARQRVAELKQNRINPQSVDVRQHSLEIFKKSAAASDNFLNQFETPVLFYLAILVSMVLLIQDGIIVVLAWSYVALRYAHCLIHLTYNSVMHRFTVFVLSVVLLFSIWVRLGWVILY
jgi:hypothetical protein